MNERKIDDERTLERFDENEQMEIDAKVSELMETTQYVRRWL